MILDLFAGPGGWDTGLAMLGRRDVVGVDWDETTCETARAAGHRRVCADVAMLPLGMWARRYRGLIASPPCQGFARVGANRQRLADRDLLVAAAQETLRGEDVRTTLRERLADARNVYAIEPLRCMVEAWRAGHPLRWAAWEQVPSVEPIWDACAHVLRAMGYSVRVDLVRAEQFGVPQARRRAILRATKSLRGVPELHATHSRFHEQSPSRIDAGMPRWVSMADALGWSTVPEGHTRQGSLVLVTQAVVDPSDEQQRAEVARIAMTRLNNQSGSVYDLAWPLDRPAPTVAGRGLITMPGQNANRHNGSSKSRNDGIRMSVPELGVLQSFPATYPWRGTMTQQRRQVGDAVPPLLAAAILRTVVET